MIRTRLVIFFGLPLVLLLFVAASALAGGSHVKLVPNLQPAQTITYLIRYQSDKSIKTEGTVEHATVVPQRSRDGAAPLPDRVYDVHRGGNVSDGRRGSTDDGRAQLRHVRGAKPGAGVVDLARAAEL